MTDDTSSAGDVAPETEDDVVEMTPSDKLKELSLDDETIGKIVDDLGVQTMADLSMLTEEDLISVGMKPVQARRLLGALTPVAPVADAAALSAAAVLDVLPGVPDDASWLEALRTGGVLKVDESSVISAVRAAVADKVGLFEVPRRLVSEMEQFAETNDEQVDPEFFRLRNQLTRRSYAEIFSAIDGLDGSFVSDSRKKQLLERVNELLWPSIIGFYDLLKSWQESWLQGAANPMILIAALAGGNAGMPPGMIQPPDASSLRDAAADFNDAINRVFAGFGVPIASALAYDATQIRKTLENPRLPAMIGAANRDQMLKQLGVGVGPTYARLETNLTRFVLGIMQAEGQPAGNEELQYFGALYMLGSQIPWGELDGRGARISGIGGNRL
jgi:hypothetical protein